MPFGMDRARADVSLLRYHDAVIPESRTSLAMSFCVGLTPDGYVDRHVDLMLELMWSRVPLASHADVVRIRMERDGL